MDYTIINELDFQKARKKIKESKGKKIVFTSSDDELNRKIMEKETIDVLIPVLSSRKDRMRQRDSGFNQVLAKIAKRRGISIGIDFDQLVKLSGKEKVEFLGRIRQNVKICAKNKVKMTFVSKQKKDGYDLKSLGLVLSMPTWMTASLS